MPCFPRPGYTRLPPPSHPPPHPCRGRQPPVEEPQGTVQVRVGYLVSSNVLQISSSILQISSLISIYTFLIKTLIRM